MMVYRQADRRFPFFWESSDQPAGRWHAAGEGPVQYCAETPDGAWAEFLRHEGITEPEDLAGIQRSIWAIEVPELGALGEPRLARQELLGGEASYPACQREARRLRSKGVTALRAPSAALVAGAAGGWKVEGGSRRAAGRDPYVIALFGRRPDGVGWRVAEGRPSDDLLAYVQPL